MIAGGKKMTGLTELRILQLAKKGALEQWSIEQERLKRNPDNDLTKRREQKSWEELKKIEKILRKVEIEETLAKIEKAQKL